MFFLNLPTREEREAIFTVHLKRFRPDTLLNFQVPLFGQLDFNYDSADIDWTSIEEVLENLQSLVQAGKIRYVGLSIEKADLQQ